MKEQIIAKVKEAIEAPSCSDELKVVGEKYIRSVGTEAEHAAAEELIAELENDVCGIQDSIRFFKSDLGRKYFGDKVDTMIRAYEEAADAGEDTCLCPACQAGKVLLAMRDEILK